MHASRKTLESPTWVVLTAIILLTFNLRAAITGVSPLLERISSGVGLTGAEIGVLGALPPFCFAAAGLFTPILLRHLSAERVVIITLALAALGQLLRPLLPGAALFIAATLIVLLGQGMGNVVLPALVKAWFPARIGLVTAIYVTGITLGTALPAAVAVPIADAVQARTGSATTGWQVALGWWAGLAVLVVLPWLGAARRPRTRPTSHGPSAAMPSLWRNASAWGIALIFAVNALHTYAWFAWLPLRLTDAGLSEADAGQALAVYAVVGVPAALIAPGVTARIKRHGLLVAAVAGCAGIGEVGLLFSPAHATLLWVLITGIGGAGFPIALTLVGLRSATPEAAGQLSGFAQAIGYTIAGLGPLLVGLLHDVTGSWIAAFVFLWLTLIVMCAGGWLAGRPAPIPAAAPAEECSRPPELAQIP